MNLKKEKTLKAVQPYRASVLFLTTDHITKLAAHMNIGWTPEVNRAGTRVAPVAAEQTPTVVASALKAIGSTVGGTHRFRMTAAVYPAVK